MANEVTPGQEHHDNRYSFSFTQDQLHTYYFYNLIKSYHASQTYLEILLESSDGTQSSFIYAIFHYYMNSTWLMLIVPALAYCLGLGGIFSFLCIRIDSPFDETQARRLKGEILKIKDFARRVIWGLMYLWIIRFVISAVKTLLAQFRYLQQQLSTVTAALSILFICFILILYTRQIGQLLSQSMFYVATALWAQIRPIGKLCAWAVIGLQFIKMKAQLWSLGHNYQKPGLAYQSLHKGEFRLLRLNRRIPFCDPEGVLFHITHSTAPDYLAISYTWGTANETKTMTINGHSLRVTRTTFDALKDCASIWRSRVVWIDQVCINQSNLAEKSTQVPMMYDIYRDASLVVAHLGSDALSSYTFALIVHLSSLRQDLSAAENVYHLTSGQMGALMWSGMTRFLTHQWFKRVWIIQEIAVARKVVVMYGGISYDWNLITQLMKILLSPGFIDSIWTSSHGETVCKSLGTIHEIDCVRNEHQEKNMDEPLKRLFMMTPLWSLPSILCRTMYFQATDPRDKIYAVQSLVWDGYKLTQTPDYTKPVKNLYLDFARATFSKFCDPYYTMGHAGIGHPRNLDLPSWVPDWSSENNGYALNPRSDAQVLSLLLRIIQLAEDPQSRNSLDDLSHEYTASIRTKPQCLFSSIDKNVIYTKGVMVGSLAATPTRSLPNISHDQTYVDPNGATVYVKRSILLHEWHQEALQLAMSTATSFQSPDACVDAFWRTLVVDRWQGKRPAPSSAREHYEAWVVCMKKYYEISLALQDGQKDVCLPTGDMEFSLAMGKQVTWMSEIGQGSATRRFGLSDKGNMCVVPPLAQVGDLFFISFGASTPWVLRPMQRPSTKKTNDDDDNDDKEKEEEEEDDDDDDDDDDEPNEYQFVGECYVRGMMDGEMMEGVEEDRVTYENLDADLINVNGQFLSFTLHEEAVRAGTADKFEPSGLQAEWVRLI